MSAGWIKLHRQLRDSPYYKIGAATQTWLECLLRASHQPREVFLKRERITLQAGEFVMGREEFGAAIGLSGSTAWYWLLQFEADGMIDIRKTAKGSIVSVKNWADYQEVDSDIDNKKPADEQQMNTNKKVEKEKNEKNYSRDEIEKWLGKMNIDKPGAYLDALARKATPEAIAKAWKDAKRGVGIESPGDFWSRCLHYSNV